jgi:hypothetical protein
MPTSRPPTSRVSEEELAELSARYRALLSDALAIAQHKAVGKAAVVREILARGTVEGLEIDSEPQMASVSYRAAKYRRTWHTLIPWQYLQHTTAELEAEAMIQTVEDNVSMTETNSWPPLPGKRRRGKSKD